MNNTIYSLKCQYFYKNFDIKKQKKQNIFYKDFLNNPKNFIKNFYHLTPTKKHYLGVLFYFEQLTKKGYVCVPRQYLLNVLNKQKAQQGKNKISLSGMRNMLRKLQELGYINRHMNAQEYMRIYINYKVLWADIETQFILKTEGKTEGFNRINSIKQERVFKKSTLLKKNQESAFKSFIENRKLTKQDREKLKIRHEDYFFQHLSENERGSPFLCSRLYQEQRKNFLHPIDRINGQFAHHYHRLIEQMKRNFEDQQCLKQFYSCSPEPFSQKPNSLIPDQEKFKTQDVRQMIVQSYRQVLEKWKTY